MAVLSVTIPDAAVARVQSAVAKEKGLPGPATNAQVQDACRDYLRELCLRTERVTREQAVQPATEAAVAADFPKPA